MSQTDLTLRRPRPTRALISLVSMIDVLLIMLVFFMVTSTYLDLDMVPAVSAPDPGAAAAPSEAPGAPLMIRLGADGVPVVRGQALGLEGLRSLLDGQGDRAVVILPSGGAQMQALISVMDVATQAGVTNLRVIRLEASQ